MAIATWRVRSSGCPGSKREDELLFRRLLLVALLLETGLLLVLIPWSAFWDRNYFFEASSAVGRLLTSNYTRGAITGLGLVNVWAALGELTDLFGRPRSSEVGDQP